MRRGSQVQSGKMMFYGDSQYQGNYLCVMLKEPVRPDVLRRAVDKAVESQPWVCYGVEEEAGAFFYHDGLVRTLQVSELEGDTLPELGGEAAQGHLMGVYYRGNAIYFSAFHGLTDGRGETMFSHEVLCWYAHEVLGVPYEAATPAVDMDADPFEILDDALDRADLAEVQFDGLGGLSDDFLIEEELSPSGSDAQRHFLMHMDAADLMAFAKREQIKASAALCTLYAAAVLSVHPSSTKLMRIAVPADMRGVLSIPGTHRNAAMPPLILEIADYAGIDMPELAQRLNQFILERSSEPAKLLAMKAMAGYQAMMPQMPFAQMEQVVVASTGEKPQFTFNCSYAQRYTSESFLPLVEDAFVVAPSYGRSTVLVAVALPDHFAVTLNQGGSTQVYVNALLEQLRAQGIKASLVGETPVNAAYVALRETLGLKS